MLKIGVSQEIDIGVIQFLCGSLMIWKKLFALVQLRNSKNFLDVEKSPTCIESLLITLPFHQSKVKVFSEEFQKYLIVGSKVAQCLSLNVTIPLTLQKKNSLRDSQLTSLLKV
jgi:hypothetical protein